MKEPFNIPTRSNTATRGSSDATKLVAIHGRIKYKFRSLDLPQRKLNEYRSKLLSIFCNNTHQIELMEDWPVQDVIEFLDEPPKYRNKK